MAPARSSVDKGKGVHHDVLIVRHIQIYIGVYSMWLVTRIGKKKRTEQCQIAILAHAVGLLVLSSIGFLASPSLSSALEKYGRPLPSMEQETNRVGQDKDDNK